MDIYFKNRKIEKEFNNHKKLVINHGPKRAELIERRLTELKAADVLEDMRNLPGPRCHELRGNLKGYFSVDLDHPYRLLFTPYENPPPYKEDGGIDWKRITSITIENIEDIHD
jgi:proteic killer suppression protein